MTTAEYGVGHRDASGKVTLASGDEAHTTLMTET
jgi:hypothetical protein